MTEQQEREIQHLVEIGDDPHSARLRVLDDDLWIMSPSSRFALEGEDAVEQWTAAVELASGLAETAHHSVMINDAMTQLLSDARDRAHEALRRARERVIEAG